MASTYRTPVRTGNVNRAGSEQAGRPRKPDHASGTCVVKKMRFLRGNSVALGMPARTRRALATLLVGGALSGSLIALAAPNGGPGRSASGSKLLDKTSTSSRAQGAHVASLLDGFDPRSHRELDGRLVSDLPGGKLAELTLDAGLQAHLAALLQSYEVPVGAVVAIEPASGRVLAYVGHASAGAPGDVARDASAPSASVFKLITASALLDAGVAPETRVCYGGGLHRLLTADITDDPRRDRSCASFEDAIGSSINAIVAKLADRNLDRTRLQRYAEAFGFGHALPFDAPTQASTADIPDERLEFARTAAGFWHTRMSPLHAALIAATIANDGVMPRAAMVERVLDAHKRVLYTHEPSDFRNVIPRATANTLGRMMLSCVSHGTARGAFYDPQGHPFLPGIAVAGKTGSLSEERPYRAYSWWVGFAPQTAPEIAVAALVVNSPKWRIKASYVAREALRYYLIERKANAAAAASSERLPGHVDGE